MRRSCEEGLCICLIFFFGPSKFSPATRRTFVFGLAEMPRRSRADEFSVVIFFPGALRSARPKWARRQGALTAVSQMVGKVAWRADRSSHSWCVLCFSYGALWGSYPRRGRLNPHRS